MATIDGGTAEKYATPVPLVYLSTYFGFSQTGMSHVVVVDAAAHDSARGNGRDQINDPLPG